jgi:putative peptidoglycan lipid II flippase
VPSAGWLKFFVKLVVALLLMGLVGFGLAAQLDWIALQSNRWMRAAYMGGVIVTCMLVYFGSLFVMGFRLRDFRKVSR